MLFLSQLLGCLALLTSVFVSATPLQDIGVQPGQIIKNGTITPGNPARFTFVDVPDELGLPCDMANIDGSVWVQFLLAEKLARIDPNTHKIVEQYDIPFTGPAAAQSALPSAGGFALLACVIRSGNDGNLYAANGLRNQLVKLDMTTKKVTVFTPPSALSAAGNLQPLNDLWGTPEGMFFSQSSANLITLFDYYTHKFKSWKIPTPGSLPLGMRKAYDERLYFTELAGQKIGALNPTTGVIQEYPLPVPELLGPAVLRVETDSKYVWFTGALSDSIGRLDIYTGQFKSFPNNAPLSYAGVPSEITEDNNGFIWFDTWTQNLLHRLNRISGVMEHISIPGTAVIDPISAPFGFGIGINYFPVKNQIYFTLAALNTIGIYQLL